MFTRKHRIGRHLYIEALESYRDPETGRPRHRCLARWRAATARLSALTVVRDTGLPADEAAIEQAQQSEGWAGIGASIRTIFQQPSPPDLTGIAERVRRLATQNDLDALRAEIAAIAADLDALRPRS